MIDPPPARARAGREFIFPTPLFFPPRSVEALEEAFINSEKAELWRSPNLTIFDKIGSYFVVKPYQRML
ncbi:MAG: hypothetical protein Q8P20_09370 [bacterium]|nr:hypothetical protein [bacterium]